MPVRNTWFPRHSGQPPDPDRIGDFAARLEISPSLAALLWQRGFQSLDDMSLFLSPNLRNLAPPPQWPGFEQGARVLAQGLAEGRTLLVWGDYDVDGITSTALVKDFLAHHGYTARHYIPSRLTDGYGLSVDAIERFAAEGVSLLLTVDCGITDVEAVARARELGMKVVISDHHLPAEILPGCFLWKTFRASTDDVEPSRWNRSRIPVVHREPPGDTC